MPHDIAPDIYRYLAHDWGLAGDELTANRCEQLRGCIPELRRMYRHEREIPYHKPRVRRAYLAAFAPRYAYVLFRCLNRRRARAIQVLQPWHRKEAVVCLMGGGPACELVGLLDWLYSKGIEPRFLKVIILDREGHWRTFHNFLFSQILGRLFRKTLVVPSYESVSFPVVEGRRFERASVSYNFSQVSEMAEARLICLNNCLSELKDHRGFACHLRFLMRIAHNPQLVICADSAARKRRPRMAWLRDAFDRPPAFRSDQIYDGIVEMKFPHLKRDATTDRIFAGADGPLWLNSMSRWVHIQTTG